MIFNFLLPSLETQNGIVPEENSRVLWLEYSLLAGNLSTGKIDSNRVNKNSLTIDCYVKPLDDGNYSKKPNRFWISGTTFQSRFEYINNTAIQSFKESFEFGIQIFSNFYIYPVFLIDGFYRLCIDTSIEGISRTAGSGNSTEDVDENFFEIQ